MIDKSFNEPAPYGRLIPVVYVQPNVNRVINVNQFVQVEPSNKRPNR